MCVWGGGGMREGTLRILRCTRGGARGGLLQAALPALHMGLWQWMHTADRVLHIQAWIVEVSCGRLTAMGWAIREWGMDVWKALCSVIF